MMEDLAMHLIEILMNSIHALAKHISVVIKDSEKEDVIDVTVCDDGKGMSKEMVEKVTSPFTTSRTTRKFGMGLAFLKGLCELCNGFYTLESELGRGTTIHFSIQKSHIDAPPLGDLGEMSMAVIQANEEIQYTLTYKTDQKEFHFSTDEVKAQLDGLSLLEPSILLWIKEYINQGVNLIEEDA